MKRKTKGKLDCKELDKGLRMNEHTLDALVTPGHYKIESCDVTTSEGFPEEISKGRLSAYLEVTSTNHSSDRLKDNAIGQVLTVTDSNGVTNIYTRNRTNINGAYTWSEWSGVGGKSASDIMDGAITTQKLSSEIAILNYNNSIHSQLSGNLFDKDSIGVIKNRIFIDSAGNIVERDKYNLSDYIAVVPGKVYSISSVATLPHGYDIFKKHLITIKVTDNRITIPDNVFWIRLSYYDEWSSIFCFNEGTSIVPMKLRKFGIIPATRICDNSITEDKLSEDVVSKLSSLMEKKGYFSINGDLADGQTLNLPQNSIEVGEYITFSATIGTSFNALYVGHGKTNGAYMKITSNEVILYSHVTNPVSEKTFQHGLTIENNIQVYIEKLKNSTTNLKIASNGKNYTFSYPSWYGNKGKPFVESDGCELNDCVFSWTCEAINSDIWAFGDSYFGVTGSIRWMAYMINENHTNLVVNGFGGQGSVSAYTDLTNLLTIGTPKKILWCLGMNDADSSTAVNANWLNTYNSLKSVCETNNIELILATIPTVPTRIHKFKNEIIRSSGYRYIDFDKAVGADEATGVWFGDMLSSDGVHPTETGALTLYNRAIADMPELLNC